MLVLKYNIASAPRYMSAASAGADLLARIDVVIPAGGRVLVPTGVWIERVDWSAVPAGMIPELHVRARSGLAWKHGVMLANGMGTVDADYPDEIMVALWNTGREAFEVKAGDRVAQMVLNLVLRIPGLDAGGQRMGGFGSTGVATQNAEIS